MEKLQELRIQPEYDVDTIVKKEFTRLKDVTYLDHAATTLYSEEQIRQCFEFFSDNVLGNPHSRHASSDLVTQKVDHIRQRILEFFNTTSDEYSLIFTSSATDALKTLAQNFSWSTNSTKNSKNNNTSGTFIYTQENHTSVLGIRGIAQKNSAKVISTNSKEIKNILEKQRRLQNNPTNNSDDLGYNKSSLCQLNNNITSSKVVEYISKQSEKYTKFYEIDENSSTSGFNGQYSNTKDETLPSVETPRNVLFAYPAQCNFSGSKYPLDWIEKVHAGELEELLRNEDGSRSEGISQWFTLLDAASYVATNPLDLSLHKPDFVPISFYKIFGYPTGLGCLLVHRRAWGVLSKDYFGGGTVQMVQSRGNRVVMKNNLHERFEDGTLPFMEILALETSLNTIKRITGSMHNIQSHVFNLVKYVETFLRSVRHYNGLPVAEIYSDPTLNDSSSQWTLENHGSIINFSLLTSDGSNVGYSYIEEMSSIYNIHLRTGCLCNPGACQKYLDITSETLEHQFKMGHTCGDSLDLIDDKPTGSTRISFGYMSTYDDADRFIEMIREAFVEGEMIFDDSWTLKNITNRTDCKNEISNSRNYDNSVVLHKENDELNNSINGTSPRTSNCNTSEQLNNNQDIKNFAFTHNLINNSNRTSDTKLNQNPIPNKLNNKSLSNNNSNSTMTNVTYELRKIIVYPIKSCDGMEVDEWHVSNEGLLYDRKWMIIDSNGTTMTQKRLSKMCLIKPIINLSDKTLTLRYPSHNYITININTDGDVVTTGLCIGKVCGDKIQGIDCGEDVSLWLSTVLEKPGLKLIHQTSERLSKLTSNITSNISLANESQYLLVNKASIEKLLSVIPEGRDQHSVDQLTRRFRANFVIDGEIPFEEDNWKSVKISDLEFKIEGKCRRCQMVGVIPQSGARSVEPMRSLAQTRGSNMYFGVHASGVNKKGIKDPIIKTNTIIRIRE